ncbi:MAG: NADH dehydrogenase [Lentisphaerae bacterium GWF2_45_14]|nr:MAG: NADH dehydrogenase [Lentisphaerae bacterium GWF2_45_14]
MDIRLDFIFRRRSIRQYREKEIASSIIKELLEAGMSAPSAMAKDPWHFIVIRNKETLKLVAAVLPNGKMLEKSDAGFVICGDISKAHGNELSYMLQDCSAAIENILLAAPALGLGACWLGVHPRQERIDGIRKIFGLPDNIIPVAAIALGYPDEEKAPSSRYAEASVHYEKW